MRRLSATIAVAAVLLSPAAVSAHNTFWSYGPAGGHDGTLTCDEARFITAAGVGHSGGSWETWCGSRINPSAVNTFAANPFSFLRCVADQDAVGGGLTTFFVECRHG